VTHRGVNLLLPLLLLLSLSPLYLGVALLLEVFFKAEL